MEIGKLYKGRFNEKEQMEKNKIWKILCSSYFQRYIPKDSTVLDIGAGYCEFINNIKCGKKYAVDLNEDTSISTNSDLRVFKSPSTDLFFLSDNSIDIDFMSNLLEHLRSKEDIIKAL